MQKKYTYGLGVIIISLILFLLGNLVESTNIAFVKDGYSFIEISKEDLAMRAQKGYVFVLDNASQSTVEVYRIISDHSAYRPSSVEVSSLLKGEMSEEGMIVAAHSGTMKVDTVLSLSYPDLVELLSTSDKVIGRWVIPEINKDDLWERIDDSALIFIVFAFFFLLIRLPYEGILLLLKKLRLVKGIYLLDFIFLLGLFYFFYHYSTPAWYSASKYSVLIENAILILPIYLLLDIIQKRFLNTLENATALFYRFCFIICASFILAFLGNGIASLLDLNVFGGTSYSGIYNKTRIAMMIGFSYAFALADLCIGAVRLYRISRAT